MNGIGSFKVYDDGIYTAEKSNYFGGTNKFIITKKLFSGQTDTSFDINGSYSCDSPTLSESHREDEAQQIIKLDNGDMPVAGFTDYVYGFNPMAPNLPNVYQGGTIIKIKSYTLGTNVYNNKNLGLNLSPFQDKVS